MRDLFIKLALSDEEAELFENRMAMVVAVSEEEAAILRADIIGVHDFLKLVRRGAATLRQILETRGTMEPDIARTLDMLIDPAATADDLQDRTRECLGRAMFVSAELPKRRLQ